MRVRILGSAAGGGFPQWNCGCPICEEARVEPERAKPRLQDCVAISAEGEDFFLLNASPDVHSQIGACRALRPIGRRGSPICGVVLTNGDLDHCLGLLSLRESHPLTIYATEAVYRGFAEENAMFRTLARFDGHTVWQKLELDRPVRLVARGRDTGLDLLARAAPGKLPIHLNGLAAPSPEQNVGVWVRDARTGKQLAYVPSAASLDGLVGHLEEADCVLFDGTFWSSDEMIRLGVSKARAEDLAHLPIGGELGSLERLRWLRAPRKLYTHLNNTNPLLLLGSAERRAVLREGWEIAEDGMEIDL